MKFKSSEPLIMYYKYSNNEELEFFNVDLKKRKMSEVESLDLLYSRGRKIDDMKNQDL